MSREDEISKLAEAMPDFDVQIPRVRRYLKGKGLSDDDLNAVVTADEVLNYHNQMNVEQKERNDRLKSASKGTKKKQYAEKAQAITNDDNLSTSAKIEALLTIGD